MALTRRQFLKSVGVAAGGVGLAAAGYDKLVPYIHQPDDIVPGVSTWYATSCRECPAGCAMVVRNRESHVVKCEGNPQQPISFGTLCSRGQAALHGLYDPDRVKGPMRRTERGDFEQVRWNDALDAAGRAIRGRRVVLMTDLQTGSLDSLMRKWAAAMGRGRMVVYEPINYESVKTVSGGVVPSFRISGSDFLISFAADFLETWISPIEYAVQFASMRQIRDGARGGFVYIGPRVSMTGANADRRLVIPPGTAEAVALAIVYEAGRGGTGFTADSVGRAVGVDPKEIREAARRLSVARAPLALPGLDIDSARAAALINGVFATSLIDTGRPHAVTNIASRSDITGLIRDMENGGVDALIVHGSNPVFSLSESARFVDALKRVPVVVSLSSFMDETSARANWVLPSNTPLESWGDYRPYPDVANLMQPTMGTLFDTRHAGDILIELARRAEVDPVAALKASNFHEYLRLSWGAPVRGGSDEWEAMLQRGGRWPAVPGGGPAGTTPATGYDSLQMGPAPVRTASSPAVTAIAAGAVGTAAGGGGAPGAAGLGGVGMPSMEGPIRLFAFPHIHFYDGRNANRRWLQEMPEPVTKAVWGTWAEIAPGTAEKLGVGTDDIIEITHEGAKIRVPVYVREGVARDTVAVPIGEGHTDYGRFASGVGVNVLPLLGADVPRVDVKVAGGRKWVTRIKGATDQHGRGIVQTAKLGEAFRREEEIAMPLPSGYGKMDFYPGHGHRGYRWAMVVDLDKCIGCQACVTACYAENNLPVVGPEGIYRRREMSWIRIDPYTDGYHGSDPVFFQPMLCQHCDAAPCEPVCPVFAAAHNNEGINMQVYNRCVGTRYCANNCPYKVRRFNWFEPKWPEPLNWQLNPDVTVRSRGVMEKCTFCIQRIRQAEITAVKEGRRVRDGEVTPACVQTCPTGVFTFGDLKDPNSRVAQIIHTDPRAYQVLRSLNTKTAVIYLKRMVG